jgi:hypothetical protein
MAGANASEPIGAPLIPRHMRHEKGPVLAGPLVLAPLIQVFVTGPGPGSEAQITGKVSGVRSTLAIPAKPDHVRVLAVSTDSPVQNAPIRMAPTKANAMQMASTFSLMATSAGIGLLAVE